MASPPSPPHWPSTARLALTLTFDNMGEAADLNRNLWPPTHPIGSHYSVTRVLPRFLSLVKTYDIKVTYFAETWNLDIYPDALKRIAEEGHEVAWHAWQHEAWGKECADEGEERGNFQRSFARMRGFVEREGEDGKLEMYRGFRPPGGVIHGQRTLGMCREFGLGYISPSARDGAVVEVGKDRGDEIVVLPFRWSLVDAYYYMESFAGLREMRGVLPVEAQGPDVLVEAYVRQIDEAIAKGGFLSLLFHPFLTDDEERIAALESVLKHLVKRREEGSLWVAPCRDVEEWVRSHPGILGSDPGWDNSSWR